MKAAQGPILLVEDTASLQMVYRAFLTKAGYFTVSTSTADEGLVAFLTQDPALVLLDLILPDRDGLDLMQEMQLHRPDVPVIVITANASIAKAVEAMRAGAKEFLVKPFSEDRLLGAVENALSPRVRKALPLAEGTAVVGSGIIGSSSGMAEVHAKVSAVANSMATVFLLGESGTGKDLIARALHDTSTRARGPFVVLNCGTLAHDGAESDLFGHVKGAFPSALAEKAGAIAMADGGTLFLDEVCDLPLSVQPRFLRFLERLVAQPVGGLRGRKVNTRIICSSSRDPIDAVRRGQLREDLYYRLFVVPITLPPLRDREADVIEIAEHALAVFAQEEGHQFDGFSPHARAVLLQQTWPGNVRQLLNMVRYIAALHDGGTVIPEMFPTDMVQLHTDGTPPAPEDNHITTRENNFAGMRLADIERIIIEAAVLRHRGSVPRAARELDVAASTLYRKIESWNAGS